MAENVWEELAEAFEDIDPERPPLYVEPDGTSEWVTFVLTTAPPDVELDKVEDYGCLELIVDGSTGLAWMQRPFYDEELDLFEEKNWPAVLRQDFLDPRVHHPAHVVVGLVLGAVFALAFGAAAS